MTEDITDDLRFLAPPGPWWNQPWFIAALWIVACGLAFWLLRNWRRSAKAAKSGNAAGRQEAIEDALESLRAQFAFVETEQSRPYATESSAIVRRFIERRFGLRAPFRSTQEFLAEARSSPRLAKRHQESLHVFLSACDFIKFGRGVALRPELEQLHRAAVDFVSATRENSPLPERSIP